LPPILFRFLAHVLVLELPPMRKHIPTFFIILITAFAAVMTLLWTQTQQQVASRDMTLQQVVERQLDANEDFLNSMRYAVEEEIENQLKIDNKGLQDTLPLVHENTLRLVQDSLTNLNALYRWRETLMTWGQLSILNPEQQFILSTDGLGESPLQNANLLALWEEEFFSLQNERLGTSVCFLDRAVIEAHETGSHTVSLGDTLMLRVSFAVYGSAPIVESVLPVEVKTSLGYLTPKEDRNFRTLVVPTKGLLAPGEQSKNLEIKLTGKLMRATGGYEKLENVVPVQVVRR